MMGLIGQKLGMTQVFQDDGKRIPVSVVRIEPNRVLGLKTQEKHGYRAVVLGWGAKKKPRVIKPEQGQFKDVSSVPKIVREFRIDEGESFEVGQELGVDFFENVNYVDSFGTSIAKGFQGVVKRYGMRGGPASHGSNFHRRPGSIGAATFPAKVWKGKKMPGRLGGVRVVQQSLKLVSIDKENQLLFIKGAVPGHKNNPLLIRKAFKRS